uniref:TSA: Wollemia nobilis Ref_Wollemi_Transcript_9052_902 transcribed RNA sequence n=1 Tax=Wollemia nobilis TaxID=56998 RepID=A0A0C9S7C8_9CONI
MASAMHTALPFISTAKTKSGTNNASAAFHNTTHPCNRVQIGFRSFQGLGYNGPVKTTFFQQSWKKLQQADGRINGGISVRATADVAAEAPPATAVAVPQQKIRIKLRSYWVPRIEESAKIILDSARSTGAKTSGPIPLPTKRRVYCVLKSPHVHKDAREHFEKKTHQRLIDIENPNAQTIDALMGLNIPEGVDVEVKLK